MAGVGRSTIYVALSSVALASFKIGSRRLIRVRALETWLRSFEQNQAKGHNPMTAPWKR
jgi:hypothetical protein